MPHPRKLTPAQVAAIRAATAGPTELGRQHGVSHQTVRRVLTWQTYKTPEPRGAIASVMP